MKKSKKKKKHVGFRVFVGLQAFLMAAVLGIVAYYYLSGFGGKISDLQKEARGFVERSSEATFRSVETSLVYDANGELITTLSGEKDVYYLEYDQIPAYATAAIVSIEDKKFYSHHGYDMRGIMRAAMSYIRKEEVKQGGSTITQQLAKNIFLTNERTWERKVEEIFIAVGLEKKYTKEQILEFYLNNIYFGNGHYGIQAASKGYFDKEVSELDLSEIAFLCAIPNNPTKYDPVEHMDNTLERRNRILEQMRNDGKISTETCQAAMDEGIVMSAPQEKKSDYVETYTFYCASRILMAQQGFQFRTEFGSEDDRNAYDEYYDQLYGECQASLYQKGYRIYTSIDMGMQAILQDTLDSVLSEYTETNEEGVYALQGSSVCIDNHSGLVKAIVGGRDQNMAGYTLNRAYQSFRQPGSAIKPLIVYTPSLERGYTPDSIVLDEPIEDGPENANGAYEGEVTLRYAVEKSKNTIAWRLFEELSPEVGLSYLEKMGFARLSPEDYRLPSALGGFTTGVSALEMASGYAALENDGLYRAPTCIRKITDSEGNVIYEGEEEAVPIYEQNAARMMTSMLEGVLTTGTGSGLALSGTASAGKTGTTNENRDGWFVGYTNYYTTSVWVGYDMPKKLPGLSGSSYPGMIWYRFMEQIHQGLEPMEFLPYIGPVEDTLPEGTELEETEPEETEPEDTESEGTLPGGTEPNGGVIEPEDTMPEGTVPEDTEPNGGATEPGGTVPEGTVPEGTVPEDTEPNGGATEPEGTIPEGTVPEGTEPNGGVTTPEGTTPEGTVPEGTTPGGGTSAPEGSEPNGGATAPEGTTPQGTEPNGGAMQPEETVPEGTVPQGGVTEPEGTTPQGTEPNGGTTEPEG